MKLPLAFVVVWSTGYIAGPIALHHSSPLAMLALRFTLATAIFLALAFVLRSKWPSTRSELMHITLAGLLVQGVQFAGVYGGMSLGTSAGVTALIVGTMPLLVALLSERILDEHVDARQWVGLGLGFLGVAVVIASRSSFGSGSSLLGIGLVAGGTLALALGTLYQKRFAARIDFITGGALQSGISALALVAAALLSHSPLTFGLEFDLALAWIVGVNSLGAASMMIAMLKRGEANKVASWFFLIPPVSAAMSALVLGERFTALTLLGFALAAGGVGLATRRSAAPAAARAT
jgi:drug/metabolite transporter (DMT)-like permease